MDESTALPIRMHPSLQEGETALLLAAQHDPTAFGELYQRYLNRIYSYMRARTSTDEDAADLTEQAFLQAFRAMPSYRDRGVPFAAWLFRIAHNVAVDAHRQNSPTMRLDVVPERLHPTDGDDPEAVLLRSERITETRALLEALPHDKREIVVLRFAAGLTLKEIAAAVGKSESTVHHHLQVALQTLKEQLNED